MAWTNDDIPWDRFRRDLIEADLVRLIAAASLVEYNAEAYGRYLAAVFADDAAFSAELTRWVDEERPHGEALRRWSTLADPTFAGDTALQRFSATITLPEQAQSVRGSRLGELVARCTVEVGTHTFYSAIAQAAREPVLRQICRRIAADEARHYKLFFDHARRYRGQVGRWRLLLVAIGRMADTGDDELAFAWHAAAGAGAGGANYRRRRDGARFHLAGLSRYRRRHIDHAAKLLAQAVGFPTTGWFARIGGLLGWRALCHRLRTAEFEAGGCPPGRGCGFSVGSI